MFFGDKVKIGPHYYDVLWDGASLDDQGNRANINTNKLRMRVDETMPPSLQEESVFHEIIHAVDLFYGDGDIAEKQVKQLSKGLYTVLRDNNMRFDDEREMPDMP